MLQILLLKNIVILINVCSMNSKELRDKILDLKPHYKNEYREMIDAISKVGEKSGKGNIAQFGPYYQTYMYACVIGLRKGESKHLEAGAEKTDFAPMQKWKPAPLRDYIIMMLLNRSSDYGYSWIDLEGADDEKVISFVRALADELEGYANTGLEYLMNLWKNQRLLFQSPTVFVDILTELSE